MKKIISLLLAALLIAALVIPVLADTEKAESDEYEGEPILTVGAEEDELSGMNADGDDASDGAVLTTGAESEGGEKSDDGEAAGESEILTTGAESEGESEDAAEEGSEDYHTTGSLAGLVVSAEGAPDYVVKPDDYYMSYDFDSVFDENGHFRDIRALDYVELKNYENLTIAKSDLDAKVKELVDSMLESYAAPEKLTEGTVKDGDTINIDYKGYIDGEEMESGSQTGATKTIGVSSMIDGFLEQIVGHNAGETFEIEVTFPEDYSNEEVAGKDATFTITVNYIEGETVTPELTDEFVAENITPKNEDVKTADDLIKYFEELDSIRSTLIIDKLIEENPIPELPGEAYDFAVDLTVIPYASYAAQYAVDLETFLSAYGVSIEEMIADTAEDNVKVAKRMLIVQAIDEAREDIKITEDDMTAFAVENFGSEDYSEAVSAYGEGLLKMYVLQDVVMKYVTEHTTDSVGGGSGFDTKSIVIAACVAGGAVLIIAVILIINGAKNKKAGDADEAPAANVEEAPAEEGGESPMISLTELLGAETAESKAEETVEEATEAAGEHAEEVTETVEETVEDATGAVEEAEEAVEEAEEAVEETAETVEEETEE